MRIARALSLIAFVATGAGCSQEDAASLVGPPSRSLMRIAALRHQAVDGDVRLEVELLNEGAEGAAKLEIVLTEPVQDDITYAQWPIEPGARLNRVFLMNAVTIAAVRVYSGSATAAPEYSESDCQAIGGDGTACS